MLTFVSRFALFLSVLLGTGFCLRAADLEQKLERAVYKGSVHLTVSPRFFSDPAFGSQNYFPNWGPPEIMATFGLYEFDFGLEPLIGLSYVQKSSNSLPSSETTEISVDKYNFFFMTAIAGARYKPWDYRKFFLVPYGELGLTYRYGRIRKKTSAVDQKNTVWGGDFGGIFTAGTMISFFRNAARRDEMHHLWNLKDFGLQMQVSYLPAGLGKHGLAGVETTGGWSFGGGMALDW